jgi:hypothetical protein
MANNLLASIPLEESLRTSHLPELFRDLVNRLRYPLPGRALVSPSAAAHGLVRRRQGYTAGMLIEESRVLEVSIFQTLHINVHRIDFNLVLVDVMVIADEVDSQLAQAVGKLFRCLITSVKANIMWDEPRSAVWLLFHVLFQRGLPLACFGAL